MRIKGLNLIIDGNFILNRNTYALYKSKEIYPELELSLIKTLEKYIKSNHFSNIYFVSDSESKSWRSKHLNEDEYKGHRAEAKAKFDIDWEFVKNTYKKFKQDIRISHKINVYEYRLKLKSNCIEIMTVQLI